MSRPIKPLQDLLGSALGRDEVLRAGRAQRVMRRWPEIVGEALAKRSWPDRYERGTVWVAVQGSAWASELRMVKARILSRMRELSGESGLFEDVRFGERPTRPPENEEAPEDHSRPKRPELEGLSIREIAERRLREWGDEGGT